MAVKSGFFNSVSGDRLYSSADFNPVFDGVINDGVFQNVGGALMVSDGSGMEVIVADGRAWFLQHWLDNSAPLALPISVSSAGFDRIDVIALDFNNESDVRENTIIVIPGTPADPPVAPSLIVNSLHKQIALAHVLIPASSNDVLQANITNKVGLTDAPFVTSVLESLDAAAQVAQWEDEFDIWFANLQAQLAGNVATNLQNQIDDNDVDILALNSLESISGRNVRKNIIINGAMTTWQQGTSKSSGWVGSPYVGMPDRWYSTILATTPDVSTSHSSSIVSGDSLRMRVVAPYVNTLPADAMVTIEQKIEGNRLIASNIGRLDPRFGSEKPLVLSFSTYSTVTGDYIVELFSEEQSSPKRVSMPYTIPTANQWVKHSVPFAEIGSLFTLNFDETFEFGVRFFLAAGSNFTSTALKKWWGGADFGRATGQVNFLNDEGNASNLFYITNVQLEVGDVASDFEHKSNEETLLDCQRYYESRTIYLNGHIYNSIAQLSNSQEPDILITPPEYLVKKRVSPIITMTNFYNASTNGGTWANPSWGGSADTIMFPTEHGMGPQKFTTPMTQAEINSTIGLGNAFPCRLIYTASAE
jgi:hypothetical protein